MVILDMTVGAFGLLYLFRNPSRSLLRTSTVILLVLLAITIIPFAQRLLIERESTEGASVLNEIDSLESRIGSASLTNPDVLRVGGRIILNPKYIFYHPVIAISVGLAIVYLWPIQAFKRPEFMFISAATAITLLCLLAPGIAQLFFRLVSLHLAPGFVLAIPVGAILGLSLCPYRQVRPIKVVHSPRSVRCRPFCRLTRRSSTFSRPIQTFSWTMPPLSWLQTESQITLLKVFPMRSSPVDAEQETSVDMRG
jgi:hypothetical protein